MFGVKNTTLQNKKTRPFNLKSENLNLSELIYFNVQQQCEKSQFLNFPLVPSDVDSVRVVAGASAVVEENGDVDTSDESEGEAEGQDMDDEEEEITLDMEDVEAVSKKARQDEDLGTEHLQVRHSEEVCGSGCL